MKRIITIYTLLAGSFLLASCMNESELEETKKVIEGIPVTATLSFLTSGSEVVTRATDEEENRVSNLYVLTFSANGTLIRGEYFTRTRLDEFGQERVKIHTLSGEQYIYAVANVTDNSFSKNGTHLKNKIDDFVSSGGTLEGWKNFTASINEKQVSWGDGNFLMSGYFAKDVTGGYLLEGEGKCIIDENGSVQSEGKIQLVRTVAKVKFTISHGGKCQLFEPTSWQVCNVPRGVFVNRQEGEGTPGEVFSTTPDKVGNNTFEFYMLENRQKAKKENPGRAGTYSEAEWRERSENAPDQGTYLVLTGTFTGTADNPITHQGNRSAKATVTYFIHLGYVNNADDYSIERNYKYNYRVRVMDVDRIVIEADTGDESHREDGDVIFYDGEALDVDAHYQRLTIQFSESQIKNTLCGIQTVKTGFEFKDIAAIENTEMDDIDWVLFMNVADEYKFGDRGLVFTKNSRSSELMNIRQLMARFNKGDYPQGGTFYAYVSEHYYEGVDPSTYINYEATGGEQKTRMMMLAVTRKESPNSSVSSARYIIRQKPITTIYNMEDAEVKNNKTFGIEWVNENLPAYYKNLGYRHKAEAGLFNGYGIEADNNLSLEDGWGNTRTEMARNGVTRWNYSGIKMYSDMQAAKGFVACMSRNRDENGNGYIDEDEIKWYLPAINQYQYLWVGTNVLPEEATLYPKDFRDNQQWEFYHYVSTGGHTFWSEEGNAIGNNFSTYGNGYFHVRCARNIGSGNSLMPVAQKTVDNGSYIEIDVKNRLNVASLRPIAQRQLNKHNEYDDNNKLYKKIRVNKTSVLNTIWSVAISNTYSQSNVCENRYGSGWRVPNQREVILITTVGGLNDIHLSSATYFSLWNFEYNTPRKLNPRGEQRMGFWFNKDGKNMTLTTNGEREVNIRCVKDIE